MPAVTLLMDKLLQLGLSTVPSAEVNPVQETIDHPLVPAVPPMSLMSPEGLATVTLQLGSPLTVLVCCPPGQYQKPLLDTLVTEKVNWVLAGQVTCVVDVVDVGRAVQTTLPLLSKPLTYWPLKHDSPAAALTPAGPCGPRSELLACV